jgi:hypothetical protein
VDEGRLQAEARKEEYTASTSDLAMTLTLRQRKNKAGHAKYWDSLAVDIVPVEEDATETRRYYKVVSLR